MSRSRGVFVLVWSGLAVAAPSWAQSVISTHSGLVYFFEGNVSLGNQRLEQKFGRFPDIGEGGELRTGQGRAEVLLTPGVFLRVGENSSIRILSSSFSDTRVEFLQGSAILEASEPASDTAVTVIHKQWQVSMPAEGVYRIDSQPPQVIVYQGEAKVRAAEAQAGVAVRVGQTLPLAEVLVAEQSQFAPSDDFKTWAMSRSQSVSADNATAAGIMDDPNAIENSANASGALSYFPLTGIPGVALTDPYGSSFWSPFQSTLSSAYFPAYLYGALYPAGWPTGIHAHFWRPLGTVNSVGVGGGLRPGGIGAARSTIRTPGAALPHSGTHAAHPRGHK